MTAMLEGRQVVVTGGTGALGQAVIDRLLAEGATCHVPSHRRTGSLDAATRERLHVVPGIDLTDQAATDRFFDGVPGLWASVHLAGGFGMGRIADSERDDFTRLMQMNALTVFLCSRAAVRNMRRTGQGGRIVNVSARPGIEQRQGARMVAYGASKAAVAAITMALSEELKDDHILVNAIAPSTLDTEANRKAMPKADPSRWLSTKAAAGAILHLIAPENTEMSGAVVPLYARA